MSGLRKVFLIFVFYISITIANAAESTDPMIDELKEAKSGQSFAEVNMANRYFYGIGVTKNVQKGLDWLKKSAYNNNKIAQYQLGKHFLTVTENRKQGLYWLNKSANLGYDFSSYELGLIYLQGKFVSKNEHTAFDYMTKAAKLENPIAQYQLSLLYLLGKGVKKSPKEAFKYAKLSAPYYSKSKYLLGQFYVNGIGIPKNHTLGLELMKQSGLTYTKQPTK